MKHKHKCALLKYIKRVTRLWNVSDVTLQYYITLDTTLVISTCTVYTQEWYIIYVTNQAEHYTKKPSRCWSHMGSLHRFSPPYSPPPTPYHHLQGWDCCSPSRGPRHLLLHKALSKWSHLLSKGTNYHLPEMYNIEEQDRLKISWRLQLHLLIQHKSEEQYCSFKYK